jgi:hypothetical protein
LSEEIEHADRIGRAVCNNEVGHGVSLAFMLRATRGRSISCSIRWPISGTDWHGNRFGIIDAAGRISLAI